MVVRVLGGTVRLEHSASHCKTTLIHGEALLHALQHRCGHACVHLVGMRLAHNLTVPDGYVSRVS